MLQIMKTYFGDGSIRHRVRSMQRYCSNEMFTITLDLTDLVAQLALSRGEATWNITTLI